MANEVKKWISKDGIRFLSKIGVKRGFSVLDFGSGHGHYAIPAAKIVSTEGKVYVIEKDKNTLKQLIQAAEKEGLSNVIIPVSPKQENSLKTDLDDEIMDFALIYDVLHYFSKNEREEIYREIHRVLKDGGVLSVYPKHNKNDWPLWNLADVDLEEIIKEITEMNFTFKRKENVELFHDEGYDTGFILEFIKF